MRKLICFGGFYGHSRHILLSWGDQMEQVYNDGFMNDEMMRGAATSLLALLPAEFTTGDLIKLRAKKGQSVNTEAIRKLLQRWRKNNRIEKKAENQWTKLAS